MTRSGTGCGPWADENLNREKRRMTEHIQTPEVVKPGDQSSDMGLALRDWLAGQALVGLTVHAGSGLPYVVAGEAYKLADEMLKARREAAT